MEKEQQIKPSQAGEEIINIRAEIYKLETRNTVEHMNETRSLFFERINKIDTTLARLIQKTRERTQINKILNERGEIMTNTKKIETIMRNYYQQLYAKKVKQSIRNGCIPDNL